MVDLVDEEWDERTPVITAPRMGLEEDAARVKRRLAMDPSPHSLVSLLTLEEILEEFLVATVWASETVPGSVGSSRGGATK